LFNFLLSHYRNQYGQLNYNVGSTLHEIGIVYLRSKNHERALNYFEEAVRVRRGLGRDRPDVALSLVKAGITKLLLRKFDEALYSFREALSIRRRALGHLHPSTAKIYNNIGCVYVEFNELREARRAFESALDVQRNGLCYEPESGPLLFGAATTLSNLGYLYTSRGLHAKTCLVLKEAVDMQQRVLGKSNPTVLSMMDSLGDSYSRSLENKRALACYKEIVARLEEGAGEDHEFNYRKKEALATVLFKMSRLLHNQNDLEAAIRLLQNSIEYVRDNPILLEKVQNELNEVKESMKKCDFDWL